jgi:hypothetical protein
MTKNRIIGAIAALSLLAVPAVAAAHGNSHHDGRHHHKHHAKKAKTRDVTGTATGTIASFTGGALTLTLPSGRSFTADVTNRTILECKSAPAAASAASNGNGDNSGRGGKDDGDNHDAGDDDGTSSTPGSTTTPSSTVPAPTGDDHSHDRGVRCGTDALIAGAKVVEAKLSLQGADSTWKKVELVK